jgi:hypothetical protein
VVYGFFGSRPSLSVGRLCTAMKKVGVAVMCCGCIWWRLAAVAGTLFAVFYFINSNDSFLKATEGFVCILFLIMVR